MLAGLAWVVLLGQAAGEKEFTNSVGMSLVRIEPGGFVMGQGEAPPRTREEWAERDEDEAPAHRVRITRAFFMGVTEVTNAQYGTFDPTRLGRGGAEPVTGVSWQKAVDFCRWLSGKEGKVYRLPTEAEWEYACRAGTTTLFHTGDRLAPDQAHLGPPARPLPAGGGAANAWGLAGLHGNVAEWCHDWYGPYEAGEQADPVGRAEGVARVVRGWSFLTPTKGLPRHARSANRSGHLPEDANRATGFRVVMGEFPKTDPLPALVLPVEKDVRQGPPPVRDASTPWFVNWTAERKNPSIPKDTWGPVFSHWNHYAAVAVCPNGDVLAAWYTTVDEAGRELGQAASRLRAGAERWDAASLFLDVPDVNDHAPVLLSDGKRIWHFFTQSLRGWDDASDCVRWSDDSGATWSKPRVILPREAADRMSQPCSAFVAKGGEIVLACDGDGHRDERLVVGRGETWQVAKGDLRKAAGKYAIHPAIVPRQDGSVLAFLRGPDPMPILSSADLGGSWEAVESPLPGISVGQKAAALRLASGAILLVSLDSKRKVVEGGGTYAALSLDDGKSWAHVRKVDGVTGYLSAAQGPDGAIHVVGSRMGAVSFSEPWLREGHPLGK